MPLVSFDALPDSARVWVFASDEPLAGAAADTLLAAVDEFLAEWRAHGVPLAAARDWRDDRFLAVGVDVTQENASGCSIDGLFRTLQRLEKQLGSRLVGGGRVFYRVGDEIETSSREEFVARAKAGGVSREANVFDLGISNAAAWRERFETPAVEGWTASLFR
jgi:hypothetical protein